MASSTNLVIGLVALVVSPIAARALGTEGRGRLVAVQLVPQLLADLAALGLGFSIVHFGARHQESIGVMLRWGVRRAIAGGVLMFGVGQALASSLAGSVGSDERLIRVYLLICPLTALTIVTVESLRAVGDFRRWSVFVLLRGLAWPVAVLSGVLRADPSLGVIVVVHLALAALLLVAIGVTVARRLGPRDAAPPLGIRTFGRFGLISAVSTVPRSANSKLDQIVMTLIVSRGNLGLYAVAVGWSALTVPVMRGLTSISMPRVSSAQTTDERVARTRQLVTFGVATTIALGIAGIGVTYVVWRPLYGADFASARSAAMVLIPATLLLEFNAVLANVLRSLDRPGLVAVLETAVLAASTVALLAVLVFDEVLGPALVSLGTYALACGLYSVFIARQLGAGPRDLVDRRELVPLVTALRRRVRQAG